MEKNKLDDFQLNNDAISRIVHAEEVLNDYQAVLEKMFIEDYGKKYQDLIHKRLLNTICITSSTPDFNYEFITKYHQEKEIYNMDAVIADYLNFSRIQKETALKCNIAYYNLICHYFGLDPEEHYNQILDIINLPFSCFSTNSKIQRKNNVILKEISNLKAKREEYLKKCTELGIEALTDSHKIDKIIQKMKIISQNFRQELLIRSSYIRNLNYSVYSVTQTSFTNPDLSCLVDFPAACTIILNRNTNEIGNLVYLPLMQIYEEGYNVDNFLLHEFRHAVEASINGIGLDRQTNMRGYHLFNEFRTEKHAKEDLSRVETIFARSNKFSGYFPYTTMIENLTNQNVHLIDDCAINNNTYMLEKIFTKEEMSAFEDLLRDTFHSAKSCSIPGIHINIKIDFSNIDDQIFKMNEIAKTNGSKRYQKILKKQNDYE